MIYFVYMYLDSDNVPFYIGKGQGSRYYVSMHLRKNDTNTFLKNKIRKVGVDNIKIHFLHKDISEEESFSWERYWIKYIGRRDKGEGTLCNLTDGGEGDSGRIVPEETRQKIRETLKGHDVSEETRRKMREALKGKGLGKEKSEEHKRKIGEANSGVKNGMYGKSQTEEAKRKIGTASKSRPGGMLGKNTSEETKRKISKALREFWRKRKVSKKDKGI